MSLTRYAIIDGDTVVNVIEYAEPPKNPPPGLPKGFIAVACNYCGPGWAYIDGEFVNPDLHLVPPPPTPQ